MSRKRMMSRAKEVEKYFQDRLKFYRARGIHYGGIHYDRMEVIVRWVENSQEVRLEVSDVFRVAMRNHELDSAFGDTLILCADLTDTQMPTPTATWLIETFRCKVVQPRMVIDKLSWSTKDMYLITSPGVHAFNPELSLAQERWKMAYRHHADRIKFSMSSEAVENVFRQ